MREGMLVLVLALGVAGVGCSGEGSESAGRGPGDGGAGDRGAGGAGRPVENDLGHQAFQPSTRLVVPAATGLPLDRVARVLAGLSEGALGTPPFVDHRP